MSKMSGVGSLYAYLENDDEWIECIDCGYTETVQLM